MEVVPYLMNFFARSAQVPAMAQEELVLKAREAVAYHGEYLSVSGLDVRELYDGQDQKLYLINEFRFNLGDDLLVTRAGERILRAEDRVVHWETPSRTTRGALIDICNTIVNTERLLDTWI